MESRKVQRVGPSSLAVSLPVEWVKKVGLEKGDSVFVKEDESGMLKIMTSEQNKETPVSMVEVNADISKDPEMIGRILRGIYALGHDIVEIVSSNRLSSGQVNVIRNVTRELMGIGIMEETSDSILIQCSIDTTKFPINTLVRRLFIISSTMHKEVIDSLLGFDAELANESIRRGTEAETMFWVIIRLLNTCQRDKSTANKMKVDTPSLIIWYRLITQYLRRGAIWAQKIAEKVVALNKAHAKGIIGDQLVQEIIAINERSYGLCHEAITSFFSSDIQMANQVIETYREIQQSEEDLQERICGSEYLHRKNFSVSKYFKGEGPLEACLLAQISFIIVGARRIAELGSEIAETAIHRVLCKDTKMCSMKQVSSPQL